MFNSHSEIDTVSCSNNVFSVDQLPICNSLFGDKISSRPLLDIKICGKSLKMELDTGSTLSCVSDSVFDKLQLDCVVEPCNENLCVANGQFVKPSRKVIVSVDFKGKVHKLPLHVVDGKFLKLFGRNWIRVIMGDDWLARLVNLAVNQVRSKKDFISSIKASKLFDPGVGEVNDVSVSLDLKHGSRPKYCKPRPIPFAIKERVGKAIDKMVETGMWKPINHSVYASPIVPVIKSDGSIRLCGHYKSTINPNLDTPVYPLPSIEDCLSEMINGELFTKLDIRQAYNNLCLNEEDQKLVTVNTHKGLFVPTKLPYGISSAGAIFQRKMDQVLKGIPGVTCRVDDICITAPNDELHMERVAEVVKRLETSNFRCRLEECYFMVPSVTYLGHEISKSSIKPIKSKAETILKAKYPNNRAELIPFLGGVQYYSRYIPNLSSIVEPLNRLRSSSVKWTFGKAERIAFDQLKKELERILSIYDPKKALKLDADASKYGLGAVLSQIDKSGNEGPIEFISRTLSKSERNYSQIEKEALAIVWSIKRLHR